LANMADTRSSTCFITHESADAGDRATEVNRPYLWGDQRR
jgi:hypothetical protein